MRKKLLAFSLALAIMIGVAVPAGAYKLVDGGYGITIDPDDETAKWWSECGIKLSEKGIFTHDYGINYFGDFSDGFLPIFYSAGEDLLDDYVDKNGNLANLNQGRYSMMHTFSEGLAAASPQKNTGHTFNGLCYVDTNGNQVIKASNEWLPLFGDGTFVGHFKNGKAVVIRESLDEKYSTGRGVFSDYFRGLYYAYIDKNGNYISEWTFTDSWEEVCKLPLYNNLGVWIGHSYLADLSKVDINAWNGEQGGQQTEPDVPQTPARQWHGPALPDYNQDAPSLFASTAKVTGFYLGDLDFGAAKITITNPNNVADAGVVAAVFANADQSGNNRAGCFFVPYELGAGESREYSIEMREIFNMSMFDMNSPIRYAAQLEGAVDAAIITFEGHDDLVSFYNTVPYEQNWQPTTLVSDFQHICDAEAGDAWLSMIGMPRISPVRELAGYPQTDGSYIPGLDADHSFCAR